MTIFFDMDGTLFAGDSQLRFARWILRRHPWRRVYLLAVLPGFLLCLLRILSLEQMKRLFLCYAWRMPREQLLAEARAFAEQELIPALYPPVAEELRVLQAAGATTVLCSASPDWWTQEVGRLLGFSHTIGTPVQLAERLSFMPPIPPPGNNRREAKLVRLAALGFTHADAAYTDSAADLPMLSIAERAVLVNPSPALAARFPGAHIMRPARPSMLRFTLSCLLGLRGMTNDE